MARTGRSALHRCCTVGAWTLALALAGTSVSALEKDGSGAARPGDVPRAIGATWDAALIDAHLTGADDSALSTRDRVPGDVEAHSTPSHPPAALLINDGALPIDTASSVAVLEAVPTEGGTIPEDLPGSLLAAILTHVDDPQQVAPVPAGDVLTAPGGAEAVAAADTVVVVVHAPEPAGGESAVPTSLPTSQEGLIRQVATTSPRTVVVVLGPGDVATQGWDNEVSGLLRLWTDVPADAAALAALLFGEADPSGRLPAPIPLPEGATGTEHDEEPHHYPLGHGLTYTTVEYDDLRVAAGAADLGSDADDAAARPTATVEVTNTGRLPTTETVQVYLGAPDDDAPFGPDHLAGWAQVGLDPGERETVTVTLDHPSVHDRARHSSSADAEAAAGATTTTVEVHVGASAADIRLSAALELVAGAAPAAPEPTGGPTADDVDESTEVSEPADTPAPSSSPEPTGIPEPTGAPEPTGEGRPAAEPEQVEEPPAVDAPDVTDTPRSHTPEAGADTRDGSGDPRRSGSIPLEVTLQRAGALSLSVDGVLALSETEDTDGRLQLAGELPQVTVTDTRARTGTPRGGWSVAGQVTDLAGTGEHVVGAEHLGWEPRVAGDDGLLAGPVVTPALSGGPGLADPAVLATAEADGGRGLTDLAARVLLEVPLETPPDHYSGTLTLTLFPVD